MDTTVVNEKTALEKATFSFVQDLAKDLNSREAIEIPSFPSVAMRVKSILEDENSSPQLITRVVGSEPGLASRLLSMANSAALNPSGRQILDLKTALNRLGHEQIRASAMSFAMKSLMDSRTVEELKSYLSLLWSHSIQVAAVSYALAKRVKGVNPDEAMFVGLVHDIGKLYILTRIESYPEIYASNETIDHILDDWHTVIGKSIIENWKFPDHVQEAIELHETRDRKHYGDADLADVVVVANLLSNLISKHGAAVEPSVLDDVESCKRMGVTPETFPEIIAESQSEIDELQNALRG